MLPRECSVIMSQDGPQMKCVFSEGLWKKRLIFSSLRTGIDFQVQRIESMKRLGSLGLVTLLGRIHMKNKFLLCNTF